MIKEIQWNNYGILGNLKLNFTKADGSVYNTIILAGENGSGKTTILETLDTFLSRQSFLPFARLRYEINGRNFALLPSSNVDWTGLGFHIRIDESGNKPGIEVRSNENNNPQQIMADQSDIRHYGCCYSKARSGFPTQPVTQTTLSQLDAEKYDKDALEDFTSLKQLLVDVDAQDNSVWMQISKQRGPDAASFAAFQSNAKMSRFTRAFNDFFSPDMAFGKIDNDNPKEKAILFIKHHTSIPVDALSTGEKQIVFRGAHLLKNSKNLGGGVALIDEPELSLHPHWQEKILAYYRGLFTVNAVQQSQVFFATHSEYVIRAGLEDPANVLIIALEDRGGIVQAKQITSPCALSAVTAAETNYLAFGIYSVDYHIELFAEVQRKAHKEFDGILNFDTFLAGRPEFDAAKMSKPYRASTGVLYQTLTVFVRNDIDHPAGPRPAYTPEELKISTEFLILLCHNIQ